MTLTNTFLVTGGAGFIGSSIGARLSENGARVRILDDLSTGHIENLDAIGGDIEFIQAGLNDQNVLRRALDGVEVVFHQAAIPSVPRSVIDPQKTHEACVNGTFNLLCAARDAGVRRLVYAASSSAYGDQTAPAKSEDLRPQPLSPYAVAKLVGEYYCQVWTRTYNFETIALRYFNVFGPRQDPSSQYSGVISRFISSLLRGEQTVIFGDGEQSRDFTFISNVVDANVLAAESSDAIGEVMNVANGKQISLNELLEVLKKLTGRADETPEYREARVGDVKHSLADISLARRLLKYEPRVELEEGLRQTIAWFKSSRFAEEESIVG